MILVDSSVWVEHLRTGTPRLKALLRDGKVLCHPFVVGELACGDPRNREEILALLAALPQSRLAEHHEVLHLLDSRRLYGRGLGWVDAHLLASALLSGSAFWTLDKRLQRSAETLRIPS